MALSLQITFREMDPSPALETRIREKAARLERLAPDIERCHVTIGAPHQHHRQGRLFCVRIALHGPGCEIAVTREGQADHAHGDAFVALRDALDAALRQAEDQACRQDRRGAHHAPALDPPEMAHGRVARFIVGEDCGFIETDDGREVYFHRNSVAAHGFDRLRPGDPVRLSIAEGEQGTQATIVHPADQGH